MGPAGFGKWMIILGLGVAVVGLLIWLAARMGLPLGRLPGDVRIEGEHTTFYFPIVTMIILSVVLTLLVNLLLRLFRRG
jgi:uncharacterized protein HemY